MNRGVAETARIVGVDSALIKRWATLFREYLGPAANPTKGIPRQFDESDLLVLLYVHNEWEDEPDLLAIKVGLNRGNQQEDAFREHLYWHTPLLQEPPEGLDESWTHGILLCGAFRFEMFELARNYRYVAEALLQSALERRDLQHSAYPILFAYRHTLELYLKVLGEVTEPTHSLKECVHAVERRFGRKIAQPVRDWMLELDEIDPRSTAFRYEAGPAARPSYAEHWLDLAHFKFAMGKVFYMVDMAVLESGTARGTAAHGD